MNSHQASERFKAYFQHGLKTGLLPSVLTYAILAALICINLNYIEPTWDFTFEDAVFIFASVTTIFIVLVILGVILMALARAKQGKLPNISAKLGGGLIGLLLAIIANSILFVFFFLPQDPSFYSFDAGVYRFLSLPCIALILILGCLGERINRIASLDDAADSLKFRGKLMQIELHGILWAVQGSVTGCTMFILMDTIYQLIFGNSPYPFSDSLLSLLDLGGALSLSLPFAVLGGSLIGLIVRRADHSMFLTKRKSIIIGALLGILLVTGIFMIAGFYRGCTGAYNWACYSKLHFFQDARNPSFHYTFQHIAGWIIAAIAGASTGGKIFIYGRSRPSALE